MEGQLISHYRIVRRLGSGGMGVVYEAEDTRLERAVALKFLPEDSKIEPAALERFQREARAASALNHPNISTIYDIGEYGGRPFLAMELLEGETLESRLEQGAVPTEKIIRWGRQIADALAAAHDKNIVHRDIKPANIFITSRGDAKVLDFGLAKLEQDPVAETDETRTRAEQDLTLPGAAIGTVAYMSPEQALGKPLDPRTDLFSLGVVIYRMATGTPAFSGNTTAAVFDAILNHAPTAPVRLNANVPQELEHIINKALEKDRQARYQSSAEMRADFIRMQRDSDASRTVATHAPEKRNRLASGFVLGLVLVAAVAVIAVAFLSGRGSKSGRERGSSVAASAGKASAAIAVLPLQNLAEEQTLDHLRLAIADEVTTSLTYAEALNVRPFSQTRRYVGDEVDPQTAGEELRADTVVTGHYVKEGDQLRVSLEAIDVSKAVLIWRDSVSVNAADMIGMRKLVTAAVESGLLGVLGVRRVQASEQVPSSEEAYDLYLRELGLGVDVKPTLEAIALLERVLELDPNFAPAWARLGWRQYQAYQQGSPSYPTIRSAWPAYERALELNPELLIALAHMIVMNTEVGDREAAWVSAQQLLESRPDLAMTHFAMSYVLRYAGLMEEAKALCNRAMQLDPGQFTTRSCSIPFNLTGDYAGARRFLVASRGTEWERLSEFEIRLREGDIDGVREIIETFGRTGEASRSAARLDVAAAALDEDPGAIERVLRDAQPRMESIEDPEALYFIGTLLVWAGQESSALAMLSRAVEGGFLVGEAWELDPLLDGIRNRPEFAELVDKSRRKQEAFLAFRQGQTVNH